MITISAPQPRSILMTAQTCFHPDGVDIVKAVIDTQREIMVIGAGMHVDEEQALLADGSEQSSLWGINLFLDGRVDWIEYDSMINLRPAQWNRSRSVQSEEIRSELKRIAEKLLSV